MVFLLKLVVKEVQAGGTAQVIQITLELPVGNRMTAGMIPAVRRRKTLKKLRITLPAAKPPLRAILPIIMPARVLTSLPRHSPVPKTAMTSIQPAGHAAMNTVRWRHAQRA